MRYLVAFVCIVTLTGCGLFAKKEVPSDVVVDEFGQQLPKNVEQTSEFPVEITTVTADELAALEEANGLVQQEIVGTTDLTPPTQEKKVDVTQEVINNITRVSPVTGPSVPEEEMRAILNNNLIENGEQPQY